MAAAWSPPPPEFPDVSPGALDLPVTKWGPELGPPASLLDLLPAGSPAAGDFNRDGFPDLFLPMPRYTDDALNEARAPRSRLLFNDGSGITTERLLDVTDLAGLDVQGFAYSASWGDADGDGFPDLFVGGYRFARLFHNDGDGTFTEAAGAGLPQGGLVLGGAWGDVDRDGHLDLFLARFSTYTHPGDGLPASLRDVPGMANALLRNRGDGTFEDASASAGMASLARRSTSAAFVDATGDGVVDVYVTNYGEPAELWANRGDGTFDERASALGLADGEDATCQAWEDLDRDGALDLFVAHQDGVADGVWLRRGAGFASIAGTLGLEAQAAGDGWACGAFDYDNDADMDLLTLHGGLRGQRQRSTLMMNRLDEGSFRFADVTEEAGDGDVPGFGALDTLATPLAGGGGALLDWDLSAAAGVAATPNPSDPAGAEVERVRLLKNLGWTAWTGNGDHLKAQLQGTSSNADGLGAMVTVQAGRLEVTRQRGAAMAWGGQSLTDLQFGLMKPEEGGYAGQPRPVNVTIRWPSGQVDEHHGFGGKRMVRFTEGGGWQNDTLPPRPMLTLVSGTAGANGWFRSDVTLRLTAQDPQRGGSEAAGTRSLRYSLDGSTWVGVANPGAGVQLPFAGDGTRPLWVETADKAGDKPGGRDNRAVFLYPVRIDTAAPAADVASPDAGAIHVQGREVARLPAPDAPAVVLAPAALSFAALGDAAPSLDAALGSDGRQPLRAAASDAASGVWKVDFQVRRADGGPVPNATATVRLAPFGWAWPAHDAPGGLYEVVANVTDLAGHRATAVQAFVLVPTGPQGLAATADALPRPQGP